MSDVKKYLDHSFENEDKIKKAESVGCYYCCNLVEKDKIVWHKELSGKRTGMCPLCGIDSIVDSDSAKEEGDELNVELLKRINEYAF